MNELDETRFRMRPDEEDPESLLRESLSEDRIEKLGQRVTLVSVLIPLLFIAVAALIYLDLNRRVALFQNSGTTEVKALAENVELQLETVRQAQKEAAQEQEKLLEQQRLLEERTKRLTEALETAESERDEIRKAAAAAESRRQEEISRQIASRPDRKELEAALAGIQETAAALDQRTQALEADLETFRSAVQKEQRLVNGSISDFNDLLTDFTRITEAMEARIASVEQSVETFVERLPADAVSPEELRRALQEEKEIYRQMLSLITRNLEKRMEALREELESLGRRPTGVPGTASPPPPSDGGTAAAAPPSLPDLPDDGKILEQSIE